MHPTGAVALVILAAGLSGCGSGGADLGATPPSGTTSAAASTPVAASATVPTEAPKTTTTLTAAAPLAPPSSTRPPATTPPAPKPAPAVQTIPVAPKPPPVVHTTPAAPKPPPVVHTTPAVANLCGAPANPYGYNYCGRGGYISPPAQDICTYFSCINNFWNGKGYMEECNDGMVSMSGGRPGACSYHGGELRPVTV